MAAITTAERLRLGVIAVREGQRAVLGSLSRLPLMRWRHDLRVADQLVLVPPDLHGADPSFASELTLGYVGLAGQIASLRDGSLFSVAPPSDEWARELHGFAWLRHLTAAQDDAARDLARALVVEWIERRQRRDAAATAPEVIGRRICSWLANAPLLLDEAPPPVYDAITESIGEQLGELAVRWRRAQPGLSRLRAVIALLQGRLCIAGHDDALGEIEQALSLELERQILPDGGHITRNPAVVIDLLFDCLPLRQCFKSRRLAAPPSLLNAIDRMMTMLRHMRLGDGSIARFNGMGATPRDMLAKLAAYDQVCCNGGHSAASTPAFVPDNAPPSRYVRLVRGRSIVVIDAGGPAAAEYASDAHAGCLSFEFSVGAQPLLVNGGRPGGSAAADTLHHRATAAHNSLCVNGGSSGSFLRAAPAPAAKGGAVPLCQLQQATCSLIEERDGGSLRFSGSHDGYVSRYGLIHWRDVELSADGRQLTGLDRLGDGGGTLRFARDLPFAIHFHLHPDVECTLEELRSGDKGVSGDGGTTRDRHATGILLHLPDGQHWRLQAEGARASLEDSVHWAGEAGPVAALQILLRAACFGESEIRWTLEAVNADGEFEPQA